MDTTLQKNVRPRFIAVTGNALNLWLRLVDSATPTTIRDLDRDFPSMISTIQFGITIESQIERTIELILALFPYVEQKGGWQSWLTVLEAGLRQATGAVTQGKLEIQIGRIYGFLGDHERARDWHEAARARLMAESAEPLAQLAEATFYLADTQYRLNNITEAKRMVDLAQKLFDQTSPGTMRVGAVANLHGLILMAAGDPAAASKQFQAAIAQWQIAEHQLYEARSFWNLAVSHERAAMPNDAIKGYQRARHMFEEVRNAPDANLMIMLEATVHLNAGDLESAESLYNSIELAVWRQPGLEQYEAQFFTNIGNLYLKQPNFPKAEETLAFAVERWDSLGDELMRANAVGTLADVYAAQSKDEAALKQYALCFKLLALFPNHSWAQRLTRVYGERQAVVRARVER